MIIDIIYALGRIILPGQRSSPPAGRLHARDLQTWPLQEPPAAVILFWSALPPSEGAKRTTPSAGFPEHATVVLAANRGAIAALQREASNPLKSRSWIKATGFDRNPDREPFPRRFFTELREGFEAVRTCDSVDVHRDAGASFETIESGA
jgi:hypothetical protein